MTNILIVFLVLLGFLAALAVSGLFLRALLELVLAVLIVATFTAVTLTVTVAVDRSRGDEPYTTIRRLVGLED